MKLIQTRLNGLKFWYKENDRFVGQRVALDKYEKYETAMLLSQVNKNSVVADVGANIGYYTIQVAKIAQKVYAFEPEIETFEILKKNVEKNGLKNVVMVNAAVGNKNGDIEFVKDEGNFGNHRIVKKIEILKSKTQKIKIMKLDETVKEKIDLIKIDTQGWESEVVEGAREIIKKYRPIIFLEYSPAEYNKNKMVEFLKSNYKNIWSINDFAEVKWPIWPGIKIKGRANYADLWIKNTVNFGDYLVMLKNVNYKKFLRGIIMPTWQK